MERSNTIYLQLIHSDAYKQPFCCRKVHMMKNEFFAIEMPTIFKSKLFFFKPCPLNFNTSYYLKT